MRDIDKILQVAIEDRIYGPHYKIGNDVFSIHRDMKEVTSNHRPDETWRYVDKIGHIHRWWFDGDPGKYYSAQSKCTTPTLKWVKDGEAYWEDSDEPHDIGHLECRLCGEHVEPGYCADNCRQYIAGISHCYINGISVKKEEFIAKLAEHGIPFGG